MLLRGSVAGLASGARESIFLIGRGRVMRALLKRVVDVLVAGLARIGPHVARWQGRRGLWRRLTYSP